MKTSIKTNLIGFFVGIRVHIRRKKDHARVVLWFKACCVLHNLFVGDFFDTEWTAGSINDDLREFCLQSDDLRNAELEVTKRA